MSIGSHVFSTPSSLTPHVALASQDQSREDAAAAPAQPTTAAAVAAAASAAEAVAAARARAEQASAAAAAAETATASERARAVAAVNKVGVLRAELLKLAREADAAVSEEKTLRAAAEAQRDAASAAQAEAAGRVRTLERRTAELATTVELVTTALKLAEAQVWYRPSYRRRTF
jgi:hypothetical protein